MLEIVATEQPDRFLQIAASLVPKGIELAVEQNRGQLTPALYALLDACLWSTPNAREIEPSVAGHRWSAPTRLMSSTMPRSERPALRSQMYDYAAGGATQVKLLILPNGIGTLADITLI